MYKKKSDNIDIIVPCFNEAKLIYRFYDRIARVMNRHTDAYFNLLFIDDGSTDKTLEYIKRLSIQDLRVKYISFSRNFGKEAAILAGLKTTKANYAIIMDADLEHPPELIDRFMESRKDYDSVIAIRRNRQDGFFSNLFASAMNAVSFIKLRKGMVDYRIINRKVIDAIVEMKEIERYSRGLFEWVGFSKKYVKYTNIKQHTRKSHWSFRNLFNYATNGLISFSDVFLNLIFGTGVGLFLISLCYGIMTGIGGGFSIYVFLLLFLTSILETSLGICALYIKRIFWQEKNRPIYLIKEKNY